MALFKYDVLIGAASGVPRIIIAMKHPLDEIHARMSNFTVYGRASVV